MSADNAPDVVSTEEPPLLDFPSFPNLSKENQKLFTRLACMVFYCVHMDAVTSRTMERYTMNVPIAGTKLNPRIFIKKFDIQLSEFIKLPEIACLIKCYNATKGTTNDRYYISAYNLLKKVGETLHMFRVGLISSIDDCIKKNMGDNFGSMDLHNVCAAFNHKYAEYEWTIFPKTKISWLGDRKLEDLIAVYCNRDVCIDSMKDGSFGRIRLQGPYETLLRKIERDQELTTKALAIFDYYCEKNPEKINWNVFNPDLIDTIAFRNMKISYRYAGNFFERLYAIIHFYPGVTDYETMKNAFARLSGKKLNEKVEELTDHLEANVLIQMLSLKGYEVYKSWEVPQQTIYMNIMEDLCSKVTDFDRDYICEYANTSLRCLEFRQVSIYALYYAVMHVLSATYGPDFISEEDVNEIIKIKFQYDILEVLQKHKIMSIHEFITNPKFSKYFRILIIQQKADKCYYRNSYSVIEDVNVGRLFPSFPYAAIGEILNGIQAGIYDKRDEDGYVTQDDIEWYYRNCHRKPMNSQARLQLFGPECMTYDTFAQFIDEFGIKEISHKELSNGKIGYGIVGNFKDIIRNLHRLKIKQCEEAYDWVERVRRFNEDKILIKSEEFCASIYRIKATYQEAKNRTSIKRLHIISQPIKKERGPRTCYTALEYERMVTGGFLTSQPRSSRFG